MTRLPQPRQQHRAERHLRVAVAGLARALRRRRGVAGLPHAARSASTARISSTPRRSIDTDLDPFALNAWLHALEDAHGRDRSGPRFGDRTLDIDIVLFDDLRAARPRQPAHSAPGAAARVRAAGRWPTSRRTSSCRAPARTLARTVGGASGPRRRAGIGRDLIASVGRRRIASQYCDGGRVGRQSTACYRASVTRRCALATGDRQGDRTMFEKFSRSWELVKASAAVLRSDKELMVFPLISGAGDAAGAGDLPVAGLRAGACSSTASACPA